MLPIHDTVPALSESLVPPVVRGTAALSGVAYTGADMANLLARIAPRRPSAATLATTCDAAWLYDASIVHQLGFRREAALTMQERALELSRVFRVAGRSGAGRGLRLLAVCAPGDLMVNTPLDFITNELTVRLDVLFMRPDEPLPAVIPDHDVAFFAIGEADPPLLRRLQHLYSAWPRPVLNDPRFLPTFARDVLPRALRGVPGLCSPTAVTVTRRELEQHLRRQRSLPQLEGQDGPYPSLIRPLQSHAGAALSKLACDADLYAYLLLSLEQTFYLTAFENYASADGLYRKLRIAFIDREPFLCHMAVSRHWMVHYLNAGMTESAEKRAMEETAMATFRSGFVRRHARAFDALHESLGFDYYSIDCGETRDGRLLIFEADTAAIIHMMDPPDLFPYKPAQMQRVFQAFGAMLHRNVARPGAPIWGDRRIEAAVPA